MLMALSHVYGTKASISKGTYIQSYGKHYANQFLYSGLHHVAGYSRIPFFLLHIFDVNKLITVGFHRYILQNCIIPYTKNNQKIVS